MAFLYEESINIIIHYKYVVIVICILALGKFN